MGLLSLIRLMGYSPGKSHLPAIKSSYPVSNAGKINESGKEKEKLNDSELYARMRRIFSE